ncbi:hypothetical protein RB195_024517 [Necator americanus]|uniref:Reverse transcriptase domain-containing protein n=1 Tax=Necator americanus TaxID=51031 RepID=A0ABR1ENM3_NECAM
MWEDNNSRNVYVLLRQYSAKIKRCSPVLKTANAEAVGETALPIWRDHLKTLLNQQAPSAPELEHVDVPTYAANEEPPIESVYPKDDKWKIWQRPRNQRRNAETSSPSEIREMTKIIRSIWIDERIPDSWRHAIINPLLKKSSVADPGNYREIFLLRVMYKVLEWIILDRLIKHREEKTRGEHAGFRPRQSTIAHVFIVKRMIKIWQRYMKPMQLPFLDLETAFDSLNQGRLLNALRADEAPGTFVRLLDNMNQQTTTAVRTPAGS